MEERARRYLRTMEAPRRDPGDPQDSHTVVFNATRALIHGFGFTPAEARPFLEDYLQRSDLPWSPGEITHKLRSVEAVPSKFPRGYLRNEHGWKPSAAMRKEYGIPTEAEVRAKIDVDLEKLQRIAAPWRERANLLWLAQRSAVDPATLSAADYLKLLYAPGEKVLCFENEYSQGEALWPEGTPPTSGKCGVWYLPQPVTGQYLPNPEGRIKPGATEPEPSRRIGRCVTAFRYLVLESDEAPMKDWLGFIVQAPLQIDAIYTSGARSIHVLVRVDARTYDEWHARKQELMPFLVGTMMMGGDKNTFSTGVRLSRLPGCLRYGKMVPQYKADGVTPLLNPTTGKQVRRYVRYPSPGQQKLLYVRPRSVCRPLIELTPERDLEAHWLKRVELCLGGYDDDVTGITAALRYYENVSPKLAAALGEMGES